jgi:hypothetical protein
VKYSDNSAVLLLLLLLLLPLLLCSNRTLPIPWWKHNVVATRSVDWICLLVKWVGGRKSHSVSHWIEARLGPYFGRDITVTQSGICPSTCSVKNEYPFKCLDL